MLAVSVPELRHRWPPRLELVEQVKTAVRGGGLVSLIGAAGTGKTFLLEEALSGLGMGELPKLEIDFEIYRIDPLEAMASGLESLVSHRIRPSGYEIVQLVRELMSQPRVLLLEHVEAASAHPKFTELLSTLLDITALRIRSFSAQLVVVVTSRSAPRSFHFGQPEVVATDFSESELRELACDPHLAERITLEVGLNPLLASCACETPAVIDHPSAHARVAQAWKRAAEWMNRLPDSAVGELARAVIEREGRVSWSLQSKPFLEGYALGVLAHDGSVRYPFYRRHLAKLL